MPSPMRASLVAFLLVGCASGRPASEPPDAGVAAEPDAKVWRDGAIEAVADAAVTPPPPPDAYQCQVQQKQLLLNPVLDLNPSGMGWIAQAIDSAAPIITGDDGPAEHSPPFKAWMGGFEGYDYGVLTVTDVLYQDVTVPTGTTELRLTGQYVVWSGETDPGVYDTAHLALVKTDGTPIETVEALSNETLATGWTAIDHVFAAPQAGTTVRVRITSTNDYVYATSFFFDTLALTATVCQ